MLCLNMEPVEKMDRQLQKLGCFVLEMISINHLEENV